MPDTGNQEITGFDHSFVGFGDGEAGMDRGVKWIKGFIKAVRMRGIQAGMIGLEMDDMDIRMMDFGFLERAKGEAIKSAVMAKEELGDAVFGDVALDGRKEIGVYVGRGIGVTEEEAGFL